MTREHWLTMADTANQRAVDIARKTQAVAERSNNAVDLAAAGALWADIARTHAAIASALPENTEAKDTEQAHA